MHAFSRSAAFGFAGRAVALVIAVEVFDSMTVTEISIVIRWCVSRSV